MAQVATVFFKSVDEMDSVYMKKFRKLYKGDRIIIALEADLDNLTPQQLAALNAPAFLVNDKKTNTMYKLVAGLEAGKGKPDGPQSLDDPGIMD